MKCVFLSAVIILSFELPYIKTIQGEHPKVAALDAYQQAELIKQQIRDEQADFNIASSDVEDLDRSPEMANDYMYDHLDKGPITPIMAHKKKKDVKHRPKEVSTQKPSTTTKKTRKEPFNLKPLRTLVKKDKSSHKGLRKPSEIFYRRDLDQALNHPVKGIHCIDLLSPYLLGETGNGTFKIMTVNNRKVLRLMQLLSEKVDTSTKDEIYSLLYQISTMNIRLFQWDERAMKLLFNTIIYDKVHTLRTLKSGVKQLLSKWHMDFGDVTNLLHQSRLFRPPCIQTSELSGSTKSSKATRYTRSKPPAKKTCVPYGESDEDCVV